MSIFSLSLASFDINIGNTLTVRYPDFELPGENLSHQALANLVIPDGAHLHKEDWTYLILRVPANYNSKKKSGLLKKKKKKSHSDSSDEFKILYGLGFFRNQRDETVRRGAVQQSILLLSELPYFDLFRPLLSACIKRYMVAGDKKALKTLFENLNNKLGKSPSINLWKETYTLNIPKLLPGQFQAGSLVELINYFGEDTMLLWKAILTQHRVLFVGQPARVVCNSVLAAAVLTHPLAPDPYVITPYVALTDIEPVLKQTYICGTTNMIFEQKTSNLFVFTF